MVVVVVAETRLQFRLLLVIRIVGSALAIVVAAGVDDVVDFGESVATVIDPVWLVARIGV